MGKKINLIGASNHLTNSTCVFGNMPGLAPTSTVRPMFTSLPGYKYTRVAAHGFHWYTNAFLDVSEKNNNCGLGKSCEDGKKCIKYINPKKSTAGAYYKGSRAHL